MLLYHSVEVTNAATTQGLFGETWPADIADAAACEEFWSWRDATRFYATLGAALPDIQCLLAFYEADHVQAAVEHPHIQQAYDGLRDDGIWCRLNPDEVYYRLVDPAPPHPPADNEANTPVSWPGMTGYHEPYGLSSNLASLAGVLEMADRAWAGNWLPNLDSPLMAVGDLSLDRCLDLRITPNPADVISTIHWQAATEGPARLALFDISGRLRHELRIDQAAATGMLRLDRLLTGNPRIASGVYWLRMRMADQELSTVLLLLDPWSCCPHDCRHRPSAVVPFDCDGVRSPAVRVTF